MLALLTHLRRCVGALSGGFDAELADGRLGGFQPSQAHLTTLIAAAGPDITARAHWLVRNNGYAARWFAISSVLIPAQAAHHNEMMSPAVTE
jgi:hypothetical protein